MHINFHGRLMQIERNKIVLIVSLPRDLPGQSVELYAEASVAMVLGWKH